MKTYRTLSIVTITSGTVELNDDQARRRRHLIRHIGGRKYELLAPIVLKAGEEFGWDSKPDKAMIAKIEPIRKRRTRAGTTDEPEETGEPGEPGDAEE